MRVAQDGVYLSVAKDRMMNTAAGRLTALLNDDERAEADQAADQARD